MKRVYLVRHGQTEGNIQNFSQLSDTPLTQKGHDGAKALAARFADLDIDQLIASPYTRAEETASYISNITKLPATTVDFFHENLRPEAVRGKAFSEETKLIYKNYQANFWSDGSGVGGAETYGDVLKRIKASLKFLEEQKSENIAVVSHGHFLRMLVVHILANQSDDMKMYQTITESLAALSNVAVTVVEFRDSKWTLKIYNDHAHFADN